MGHYDSKEACSVCKSYRCTCPLVLDKKTHRLGWKILPDTFEVVENLPHRFGESFFDYMTDVVFKTEEEARETAKFLVSNEIKKSKIYQKFLEGVFERM